MSFEETKILLNKDSKIKIDVETLARIEFSDIEYLLDTINKRQIDSRLERIIYESLISKIASIFQLAMRAYEYLEKPNLKKKLINDFNKSQNTSAGKIGKYREDLFHGGIHFLDKTVFYPFGKVKGRGFKGIYVKKGAELNIIGVWKFHSNKNEYAITSEGVFEIENVSELNEKWTQINNFPTISTIDYESINNTISDCLNELKQVWFEISKVIKESNVIFNNKDAEWDLIELADGQNKVYSAKETSFVINGNQTITPPPTMSVKDGKLHYK